MLEFPRLRPILELVWNKTVGGIDISNQCLPEELRIDRVTGSWHNKKKYCRDCKSKKKSPSGLGLGLGQGFDLQSKLRSGLG